MDKIYAFLTVLLIATSCGSTYNISGCSNISNLDGRMLYLKVLTANNDFKNLDSCDVVHGEFKFSGVLDSICMANIFMDQEQVMPVVLEAGKISVRIDNTQQIVSGTPLNDALFRFFNKYNQLKNRQIEIVHKHDQAIMSGENMDLITTKLQQEAHKLSEQEEQMVTKFICENFDNVLGPGVFFMLTIQQEYPLLTPWLEYIMSQATTSFKSNPYVKDYYKKALENQQIMNGMKEIPTNSATEMENNVQRPPYVNP